MDKARVNRRFKSERVKTAKGKKKSSIDWLRRQINDPYVLEAQSRGYRSRATFKIIELDEKFKLFKKGRIVLDLGSAPGGWSQMAVNGVGKGNVFAVDILEMEPLEGVKFLQQDFLEEGATQKVLELIGGRGCDVVMSDMAANTTGDRKTDHLRTMGLLESAVDFALTVLKKGGTFVGKAFQGGTEAELLAKLKKHFKTVKHFKPNSSRKDSVEMYVVAQGFNELQDTKKEKNDAIAK